MPSLLFFFSFLMANTLLCLIASFCARALYFNLMYFVMLSSDALHYNTLQHTTPLALHYYTMHYNALLDLILNHFMLMYVALSSNLLLCLTLTFSVLDLQFHTIFCSHKSNFIFLSFFLLLFSSVFFFISHYYSLMLFLN